MNEVLTVQMLKERTTWSVLKHHHPGKWLVACTVTKQVHEVLMVHFGQHRDLKEKQSIIHNAYNSSTKLVDIICSFLVLCMTNLPCS